MKTQNEIEEMKENLALKIEESRSNYINANRNRDVDLLDMYEKQVVRYTAQYNILLEVLK